MPTNDTADANKLATPRCTTPIRSLVGLFRTPTTVHRRNKRAYGRTSFSPSTPLTSSPPVSLPPVVLQTYSVSTDSVVLTALPSAPFCCHEDLLTMSHSQLEGVVRALNTRLPNRMRIGPEHEASFWHGNQRGAGDRDNNGESEDDALSRMSEAEMRRRIEELVGIRAVVGKNRVSKSGLGLGTAAGVPPAPKAIRTRDSEWRLYEKDPWEMEVDGLDDEIDDSSIMVKDAHMGSSPLAGRTISGPHTRGRNGAPSRLAMLREENEGSELKEDDAKDNETRPSKRLCVAFESITQHAKGRSQAIQESRLVENMDLSGSPLFAGEDDPLSDVTESNETMLTTAVSKDSDPEASKEDVPTPLQRRRSARIQEIALKRASSLNAKDVNLSIERSSIVRRPSPPTMAKESVVRKDSGMPREFTIRLPFTSTSPLKSDFSVSSTPRILRSNSQGFLRSNRVTKTDAQLARSRSERYPRATDLAFVTIDRPRYRFTRRKSKGNKLVKTDEEVHPPASILLAHTAFERPQGTLIGNEDAKGKCDNKKEKDPKAVSGNPVTSGLDTLSSTVSSFSTPHSIAPSTSAVTSTQENGSGSLIRMATTKEDAAASDGATEHVWEALERMAVDGLE